jgi:endonuclease/exonuclease/phosphatase (EEP) superfamily protein YafD
MLNHFFNINGRTFLFAIPLVLIALLVVLAPPILIFHYLEENALFLIFGYLVLGLSMFLLGKTQSMFISFACCALLCYTLQERSACSLDWAAKGDGPQVKVAHFDLDVVSLQTDSILAAITGVDADIISIQGLHTEHFGRVHHTLTSADYPFYQSSNTAPNPPGLIVYSKSPFSFVKQVNHAETSAVAGKIKTGMPEDFHFIGVYLSAAEDTDAYAELQRQMQALGFQTNQIDEPLLVFGNYNLKPWSKAIQQYKTFSQLKNSRRGVQPTQPHGYFPLGDHFSDHIFYSNHFKCISFETISCGTEPHLGICGTFERLNGYAKRGHQRTNTEL